MNDAVDSCEHAISRFLDASRKFGGFGYSMFWALDETYPLAHESELSHIWPVYESLADNDRESLRDCFDFGDMIVLFTYAARMATLAVREGDPQYLRHALLAVSIGREDVDYRDSAIIRVLLVDCGRRLNALELFGQVEPLASESMRSVFRDPGSESRALRSMGFVVTEDAEDGFRYRET